MIHRTDKKHICYVHFGENTTFFLNIQASFPKIHNWEGVTITGICQKCQKMPKTETGVGGLLLGIREYAYKKYVFMSLCTAGMF